LGFRAIRSARDGSLVISLLVSFLQRWLLERLPEFREIHPEIELQLRTSTSLVDFARSDVHAAIRFGLGTWKDLHAEKILDDWLVVVCTPGLYKRHGPLRTPGDTGSYPVLHSSTEPWAIWVSGKHESPDDGRDVWPAAAGTAFNNSAAALQAAEQGQGLALARWSLASSAVMSGALVLAHPHALRFSRSYYFVCPKSYLDLPKVAAFRAWLTTTAAKAPVPPVHVNPRATRVR
jgi:LysR family glycine cleavage system transcriptional activator